nr:MSCRAMM family adhesin SdrC [Actinomycetes bacterium]
MNGANYIGRVGSWAVAMGVAGVVATPPVIGWAEPSSPGSDTTTSKSPDSAGQSRSDDDSPADTSSPHELDGPSVDLADGDDPDEPSAVPSDEADTDDESASAGSVADDNDEMADAQVADVISDEAETVDTTETAVSSAATPDHEDGAGRHRDHYASRRGVLSAVSNATLDGMQTDQEAPSSPPSQLAATLAEDIGDETGTNFEPAASTSAPNSPTSGSTPEVVEIPNPLSAAPRVAVVELTENLPPVAPSVPALPPAPVVLYAGVRREVEQSLVDHTASGGPAGVAATAAVTRGPVAAASAAADDEPVSFFANIGRWFQQTFFAASPTFSPQAVSMTLEPGASSQLFALGAQDADTETLIYTV